MRVRRPIAQLIAGTLAVSALAASVTAAYAPSAGSNGSIEILDFATTSTLPNATKQLAQMVSAGYTATGLGADVVVGGALALMSTGDAAPIASVVQTSGSNFGVAAAPDGSNTQANRSESDKKFVLAQYN